MLTFLASILGFLGPFVPELLKLFRQKQDNTHELALMEMQARNAAAAHTYRIEELNVQADIQEAQVIHQPMQSFGVQILDAAKDWNKFLIVPVFYLFAFLDFLNGTVRSIITYSVVGFYFTYKYAMFEMMKLQNNLQWKDAIIVSWTENDWALLMLVVSYWFGSRAVKSVFGGSANTGRAGGG